MNDEERSETTRSTVHRVRVNGPTFEVMVKAVASLSVERQRFQTLRDVVFKAASSEFHLSARSVNAFKALQPTDGELVIYFRVTASEWMLFENFKAKLSARLGSEGTTRDVLCVCCLLQLNQTA